MTDVKGKWVLITGASRGIGRLTAKFMAEQGCNLILHSRKLSGTESLLKEVKELGVDAFAVSAELSDIDQVSDMLKKIDDLGVDVSIVLNNAGLQIGYRSNYLETPINDYTTSFLVNTTAPMMICYHFLPKMIKKGFGRIINTTSGIDLEPQQAGYSASKAALDKVTIDIGSKLNGSDVMINLTDPGWCRTELGGNQAPNDPKSAIPGIVAGVFADDKKSGRFLGAQDFVGMSINDMVNKVHSDYPCPY